MKNPSNMCIHRHLHACVCTHVHKHTPLLPFVWQLKHISFGARQVLTPEEGNGNSFQYSCVGNPKDKGASQAAVRGVAKNRTQLSN